MKKEFATHFIFLIALFLFVTIFKNWFEVRFITFWIGGIIGTVLPDIDHLIYVYFVNPDTTESREFKDLIKNRKFIRGWKYLIETKAIHNDLIFHKSYFQIIFIIFAVLVVTSTGSLLASGIVLAFLLHLLVDQAVDLFEDGDFPLWFEKFPIELDGEQKKWYLGANILVLLVIILLM